MTRMFEISHWVLLADNNQNLRPKLDSPSEETEVLHLLRCSVLHPRDARDGCGPKSRKAKKVSLLRGGSQIARHRCPEENRGDNLSMSRITTRRSHSSSRRRIISASKSKGYWDTPLSFIVLRPPHGFSADEVIGDHPERSGVFGRRKLGSSFGSANLRNCYNGRIANPVQLSRFFVSDWFGDRSECCS